MHTMLVFSSCRVETGRNVETGTRMEDMRPVPSAGKHITSAKGVEIRDIKSFNLSRNIVSLQVLVSRFSPWVINLPRSKNICCGLKKFSALIGWFARARANLLRDKLWVWWKTSNKANSLMLKVDPRSTLSKNFLQPPTNVFAAQHVDLASWKTENIDQNLQRNNVAWQVEGFVSETCKPVESSG